MVCVFRLFVVCALLVLSFIVFFIDVDLETSLAIECWIKERAATLTSIGTLFLVGFLTLFATYMTNAAAAARELSNRTVAAELKKSEFRQQWIDKVREDLAEIVGLARIYETATEKDKEAKNAVVDTLKNLNAKLRLRLNPNGNPEKELKCKVFRVVDAVEHGTSNIPDLREALADFGAQFIKDEWENLKLLLDKAKLGPQK